MASKENNSDIAKSAALQIEALKMENQTLSDENHSLRIKMAADGKKLVLVRDWITNFNELSGHLKEIVKDWEQAAPIQNENEANASNAVAKSNVDPRPVAGVLRFTLNRAKLAPRWPATPTGMLHNAMLGRLQKNIQEVGIAKQAPPVPRASIADDLLNVEIKAEVDDEAAVAVVDTVDTISKESTTPPAVVIEPQRKLNEKTAKKRKVQEQPKMRQTRSKSRVNNDEPTEKRYRSVAPVQMLKTNDDDDGSSASRSKSDGGKTAKRLMAKRSSNN